MTVEQFYKLMKDDTAPTPSDIGRLRALVEQYPYFEIAKFIYLKAIYQHEVQSFKDELSRLSVLLSNRESLFYYIFKDDYAQYFKKTGKAKLEDDKTKLLLDAFFDDQEPESLLLEYESEKNSNLATVDYLSYMEKEESEKEKEETLGFKKGRLLDKLIFIEEVSEKPIDDEVIPTLPQKDSLLPRISIESYNIEDQVDEVNLLPLKHQNIIDTFLESSKTKKFSPTLNKETVKEDKDHPLEEEKKNDSSLGDDVFFTETLAKIYTKQKRYEKAYEIIEHLSLKYPKKNSYFADQLRYLEKLIINSKFKDKK